jgi:hypothetical protein
VDILNAGQGRYRGRLNTTSGVETLGVPPEMSHITVANSAMNGKNTHRRQCKMCKMSSSKKIYLKRDFACLSETQNLIPPPPLKLYKCIQYLFIQREVGGCWTREKDRGATGHKAGSKIPTWLTVSPVYKLWYTPAAKSLYRSIFEDDDILLLLTELVHKNLFMFLVDFCKQTAHNMFRNNVKIWQSLNNCLHN